METLVVRDINKILSSDMKASKKIKAIRDVLDLWYCLQNGYEL